MKRFLLGVLVGFVLFSLAVVIVVFAAMRIAQRPPAIADNSVLMLRLEGEIPESPQVEIPLPFFESQRAATVAEIWKMLRRAANDSHIRAVVLMPQSLHIGWGKMDEIREAVGAFRKSGKPLYAYLRAPGAREYYIATAAERIYMAPEDYLDLKGLRAELMYFKGTLDKIGAQIEIEHAGKYKDAGDMFTRTGMSPETREVMNSVLDGLYSQLIAAIAQGRKQSPEQVRSTIDEGPFVAAQAKAKGLVDNLIYQDQMAGELKARFQGRELKRVSHIDYLRYLAGRDEDGRKIALVVADGEIVRGSGTSGPIEEDEISGAEFPKLLRKVRDDNSIRGVIVRIDSPGGDGFASDEIWREMNLLGRKKPLVVSMSDTAASGGYYMAMTGDPIVAYPGTLTGSIGVIFGKANLHGLYSKLGINKDLLTRGKYADIDSDYTPLTPAARAKLRESIDAFYKTFVSRVASARKRSYQDVDALAQGRVWLGSQAKQNGLIDQLGGFDRAIELVRKKAGIGAGEKIALVPYPPRRSLIERLFSRPIDALLDSRVSGVLKTMHARAWSEGGIMRLMPYSIEVR